MKKNDIFRPERLLYGIYDKDIIELVIDYKTEDETHFFKNADGLFAQNPIPNDRFYYQTLCVINGNLRCPVYNDKVYNGPLEENVSIEEYIESFSPLCYEHTFIHEKAKKVLVKSYNHIKNVIGYANECLRVLNDEKNNIVFELYKNSQITYLNELGKKLNLKEYDELINKMNNELVEFSYDELIENYKHNLKNPEFKKQYDSLDKILENIASLAFYLPLKKNITYEEFISLRNKDEQKVFVEMRKVDVDTSINKAKENYEKIIKILSDR